MSRLIVRSSGPFTASTMQNSVAPRALVSWAALQHLVGVEEGGGLHLGVELGRLRAEVAVLWAAAGLGREDPLDLHLGPHQASRTSWASAASDGTCSSGRAASAASTSMHTVRRSSSRVVRAFARGSEIIAGRR